jgi:cysteine desulfurase
MKTINYDNAAAAPMDDRVLEKMLPFYKEHYGNPSSGHSLSLVPRRALEEAREQVGDLINAEGRDLIFTASGSESNNLAVKGITSVNKKKGNHIIASAIEHFSILNPLKSLQKEGYDVTLLPVDRNGLVDPENLRGAITDQTILITIQAANPEIGTLQPLDKLVEVAREHNVAFHTDATAMVGWLPIDVQKLGVDLLTLAGDQFSGPKGAAALYLKRGTRLAPLVEGGIQERGLRAGTENIPALVGMGEAARLALEEMETRAAAVSSLRDSLRDALSRDVPHLHLNGHPDKRLPHNLNFSVEFVEGEALLMKLNMAGIMVSSGSSCTSQALKSSHVLSAVGLPPELAQGSLLFSFGRNSSDEDRDYIVVKLGEIAAQLRNMSPLYHQFLKEDKLNARVQ